MTTLALRSYPASAAGVDKLEAEAAKRLAEMRAALENAPDWDTTLRLQGAISVLVEFLRS